MALHALRCCYIYTATVYALNSASVSFHPGTSRCHSLGLFPTACSVHVQGSAGVHVCKAVQVCNRSQTSALVTTGT